MSPLPRTMSENPPSPPGIAGIVETDLFIFVSVLMMIEAHHRVVEVDRHLRGGMMHLHIAVEVHLKSALEFTMIEDSAMDMIGVMIEDTIVDMTDHMIIEATIIVHMRNDSTHVSEVITTITGKLSDAV